MQVLKTDAPYVVDASATPRVPRLSHSWQVALN